MGKLRWKMEPRETGLRSMLEIERTHILHDGEIVYAHVYPHSWKGDKKGWYWVARCDEKNVPWENVSYLEIPCVKEAKKQAIEYVKRHLKSKNGNEGFVEGWTKAILYGKHEKETK